MARKTETFEIEGYDKKFTVNELTVKQIISLIQNDVQEVGSNLDGRPFHCWTKLVSDKKAHQESQFFDYQTSNRLYPHIISVILSIYLSYLKKSIAAPFQQKIHQWSQ